MQMELLAVDLVDVAPTFHIAQHLPAVLHSTAPFMFVMQAGPSRFKRNSNRVINPHPSSPLPECEPHAPSSVSGTITRALGHRHIKTSSSLWNGCFDTTSHGAVQL